MTYNAPVYREIDTGKFVVTGASRVESISASPETLEDAEATLSALLGLLTEAGINPPSGGNPGEDSYSTDVYIEIGTGKIRIKGASIVNFPLSPLTYVGVVDTLNDMLALLTSSGMNPADGESFPDAAGYTTDVYREINTGKIRVKGVTRIEDFGESPEALGSLADQLNLVIDLLDSAGINPAA